MRTAIQSLTYRNANANGLARVNVTGTDVLRDQVADALFHAHVVRQPAAAPACLKALGLKQAMATAARLPERIRSSMSGPQRWLAQRGSPIAFVTSA